MCQYFGAGNVVCVGALGVGDVVSVGVMSVVWARCGGVGRVGD